MAVAVVTHLVTRSLASGAMVPDRTTTPTASDLWGSRWRPFIQVEEFRCRMRSVQYDRVADFAAMCHSTASDYNGQGGPPSDSRQFVVDA
jgi:hypothetical protein